MRPAAVSSENLPSASICPYTASNILHTAGAKQVENTAKRGTHGSAVTGSNSLPRLRLRIVSRGASTYIAKSMPEMVS